MWTIMPERVVWGKAKGKTYACGIRHLENFKDSTLVLQFLSFQQDMQKDRKRKLLIIKVNGDTIILCMFYMEPFCIYYFRLALEQWNANC